jgi:hypothetical protein
MNKYVNLPIAVVGGGNTGNSSYAVVPRLIVGAILTSKNKKFTEADMLDFQKTLQDACLASGQDRIYPMFRFKEIADGSGDVTKNTSGYGVNEIVREGKYDWTFTFSQSTGLYNLQQLRMLNGGQYRAFFIDDNGNIIGTQDDAGNFMGAALEYFYAKPWKVNEGTKPAVVAAEFAHSNMKDLNDNVAIYTPTFDVEDTVKGLLNLQLHSILVAAGKVTIGIRTEGDKVDVYPQYSTELAVVTLWKVLNVTTGLSVVPTTVAVNSAKSGWDVSLPAGTYQIGLASPAALSTALVGGAPENGYEGIPVTVTITA